MPHRRPADFQGEMEEEKRKAQTVHGFPQLFLDGKPTNAKIGTCRYCSECYDPTSNPKGSCVKAPDRIKRTIETVTCVGCAGCIQYHCSNEDDNGEHHPCSCRPHEDTGGWLRLAGLGCLSVAAPCIWCYWPLSFCYSLCVKCHCAGGQHSE